ncbi:MAG: AAA family ATPase, partial [Candidatus Binatia bacterium]
MSEPAVFGSIWRNRRFVVVGAAVGLFLAFILVSLQGRDPSYEAAATIEVIDVSRLSLLPDDSRGTTTSDRFVSTQLLIFRSSGVASRASELAVDESGERYFSPPEVTEGLTVLSQPGTDVIIVLFVADSAEAAIAGANAVVSAFQEVKADTFERTAASSSARIDAAIASVSSEVEQLESRISTFNPDLAAVAGRIQVLVGQLLAVQAQLDSAGDAVDEAAVQRLNTLISELDSLQLVQAIYENDPGLTALVQQQDRLIDWSLELTTRRLELQIDQEQAASGVGTLSPASSAEPVLPDSLRLLGLGLFLGAVAGAVGAYMVAHSRRLIVDSGDIEPILGVPFLGEVPDFALDYIESDLPVRDAARSASAESFRFVVTSLEAQMERVTSGLIAFVSSETGDGKSVVLANTSLSAAYGGRRVLVIDADFGNQALGSALGINTAGPGLTDVVENQLSVNRAVVQLSLPGDASLQYLGRGTVPTTAPDFFRRSETQRFFESLQGQYDLVLVDTPPLLQVAYAATVSRLCDAVVAIIKHEAREAQVVDLGRRLNLVGRPILGYVYNMAPLRDFMTKSDGSMKDVVGDLGHVLPVR